MHPPAFGISTSQATFEFPQWGSGGNPPRIGLAAWVFSSEFGTKKNGQNDSQLFNVLPQKPQPFRSYYIDQWVYKWYILPIGWLYIYIYITYHLLGEPETTIESSTIHKPHKKQNTICNSEISSCNASDRQRHSTYGFPMEKARCKHWKYKKNCYGHQMCLEHLVTDYTLRTVRAFCWKVSMPIPNMQCNILLLCLQHLTHDSRSIDLHAIANNSWLLKQNTAGKLLMCFLSRVLTVCLGSLFRKHRSLW